MKCPFCQQELRQDQDGYYTCYTDNCGCMAFGGNGASGSESLWQALIDTKKKLETTQKAADNLYTKACRMDKEFAEEELERAKKKLDYAITMLERIAVSPETMLEPEKIVPQLAAEALEQINQKENQ